MRKRKNLILLLCAFLAFSMVAVLFANTNKEQKEEIKQDLKDSKDIKDSKDSKAVLVTQMPIKEGVLEQSFEYIGSLYFSERSALASEVSGIIQEIYVSEGQKIKKDQPLAVLNSDLLSNEIKAQESLLKQAQANFSKTKQDYARFKALYESESISFKEYEDALFTMQAQEGNMQSIAATLSLLKEQKNKKTITAPYDGVVLQKNLKSGEWVSVGASVFNVAKLTPLEATFEVSYEILRSLRVGDKLSVKIAQKSYDANISALIPLGDAKARTFPVKLAIYDPQNELIEGLEVRANFGLKNASSTEGLLVPREAIIPKSEGSVIFVVRENRAKKVLVEVKGYKGFEASIIALDEKLSSQDSVIIEGAVRLRDGDLIQITK